MASYHYLTLDVFTERAFAGNPLAVITDARGLSAAQMQSIAAQFNYSETTFVLPAKHAVNTAEVRIFTPTNEIPFAGHPNIGTAYAVTFLANRSGRTLGTSITFEEGAGLVSIDIEYDSEGEVTRATLTAPQTLSLGREIPVPIVASCVGLDVADIMTSTHRPVVASVGLPFVIAEVNSAALARCKPDRAAFVMAQREYPYQGDRFSVFVYAQEAATLDTRKIRARMFAPLSKIIEDPATGSANAALGGLLAHLVPDNDTRLTLAVTQGVELGRPSTLSVTAEKYGGTVQRIRLGGQCVLVMEGSLQV